jgi:hypothetical protein
MNRSILWRSALVQTLAVAALSLLLAVLLPHSFFEDWGWLSGPIAWLACAALTAGVLGLDLPRTVLGAALAGIPAAIAVVAGVHWLGVAIAIGAFAIWCAGMAGPRETAAWT